MSEAAKKEGPIHEHLQHLGTSIGTLEDLVGTLKSRIGPAMRSEGPTSVPTDQNIVKGDPGASTVVVMIDEATRRIQIVSQAIKDFNNRIEL